MKVVTTCLIYGLLFVFTTNSESILGECANETLTIHESCTARPDTSNVFTTFAALLPQDIAILGLDFFSHNQSDPLFVFEIVMSDYGENVLRMKSYLEFLSVDIKGENITRRSITFNDDPDGCMFNETQQNSQAVQTKLRNWILCGFTKLDSSGGTVLSRKQLCYQSNISDYEIGFFVNNYAYKCCDEKTVNQTCAKIDKDHAISVLYIVLGWGTSSAFIFLLVVFDIKSRMPFSSWTFQDDDGSNVIVHMSDLATPNDLSMFTLLWHSIKIDWETFLQLKKSDISKCDIVKSPETIRIVLIFPLFFITGLSLLMYGITKWSLNVSIYEYFLLYFVILLASIWSTVAQKCKRMALEVRLFQNLLLPFYYLTGYVFSVGGFRLLSVQALGFMVNTQDNWYRVLGAYCLFFIPFNLQYINTLRKQYADYLELCIKTFTENKSEMNIYKYHSEESLSNSRQKREKPLFCLKNKGYAIDMKSFAKLCNLDIEPCPGHIFNKSLFSLMWYATVDVIIFLFMLGLYRFGQIYSSDAGVHVLSMLSAITVLSITFFPFFENRKREVNDVCKTEIIVSFKIYHFQCESTKNNNIELEQVLSI